MRKRYTYIQLFSNDKNWVNSVWQNKTGIPLLLIGYDAFALFNSNLFLSIQDEKQLHIFDSLGVFSVNSTVTQTFPPSGANTIVQLGDGTISTAFPVMLQSKPLPLMPMHKIVISNPVFGGIDGWFIAFRNIDDLLDYLVRKG